MLDINFWDQFWYAYLWAGLAVLIYVIIAWVVSLFKRDTSIVDIFWGAGFILCSFVFFFLTEGLLIRKLLVVAMVTIWGLRLSFYIAIRNHGRPEDPRYAAWRKKHARRWPIRSLVTVFFFQGVLMWVISLPLLVAQLPNGLETLIWLDYLGVFLWLTGFLFEAIGDAQLYRFKKKPEHKGTVFTKGLWQYTRHPNYFGEFALWWGFGMMALTSGHLWVVISPLLMSIMVMKYSGVGMLEKGLLETKPGYRNYIATTRTFFPWPGKQSDKAVR